MHTFPLLVFTMNATEFVTPRSDSCQKFVTLHAHQRRE
jgi:hypothetical protein